MVVFLLGDGVGDGEFECEGGKLGGRELERGNENGSLYSISSSVDEA